MPKKPVQRMKHVPQRTCVGCREVLPKRKMVRIVRTADGVQIDPTGKLAGRGAYLHDRRECWERGLKGALSHALKTSLTQADRSRLEEFMNALPADAEAENVGLVRSQM
ncbi:MAG TPA: YlxR family protein [Anaerolineales bacterium]|nr:YlxR family protein [Anaerolineales bacterium]